MYIFDAPINRDDLRDIIEDTDGNSVLDKFFDLVDTGEIKIEKSIEDSFTDKWCKTWDTLAYSKFSSKEIYSNGLKPFALKMISNGVAVVENTTTKEIVDIDAMTIIDICFLNISENVQKTSSNLEIVTSVIRSMMHI